jgi:hypothetical protein
MNLEIIIHNSISIDGSLTGFMPDMGLHYKIAGDYKPDAHLIGADTVIRGNEMFGGEIPDEAPSDFLKPERPDYLPWWIIVDSGARLKGMLHPLVVGKKSYNMFGDLQENKSFSLIKSEQFDNGCIWAVYRAEK